MQGRAVENIPSYSLVGGRGGKEGGRVGGKLTLIAGWIHTRARRHRQTHTHRYTHGEESLGFCLSSVLLPDCFSTLPIGNVGAAVASSPAAERPSPVMVALSPAAERRSPVMVASSPVAQGRSPVKAAENTVRVAETRWLNSKEIDEYQLGKRGRFQLKSNIYATIEKSIISLFNFNYQLLLNSFQKNI